MSSLKLDFVTPVGRLVQGHPMEKQDKDMQGNALTVKTGPNAGQPTQRYFVAVAIDKRSPEWADLWGKIVQAARAGFPTLFDAQGNCLSRDFSFKVADGDSTMVSKPGEVPNAQKQGFAGHWVLKCSSSFPPKCFYAGRYQPHEQIQDANLIKRGYYVRVAGTIEANGNAQRPGVYVNLNMVELVALGDEIVSGPDAAGVFGGAPVAALPPGAVALPAGGLAAPQAPMGNVPPMPMPGAPTFAPPAAAIPPAQPAVPPLVPPMTPAAPVQPHPAILAGPGSSAPPAFAAPAVPPVPPVPAAPAAPAVPTTARDAQGNVFPLQQLQASGWTVELLQANGWTVA